MKLMPILRIHHQPQTSLLKPPPHHGFTLIELLVACHPKSGFAGRRKATPAFTLIELLVVIAILGILVTIAIASFSTVQSKARDARRKGDLDAIKKAFAISYSNNQIYPLGDCWEGQACWSLAGLSLTGYIKSIPGDPKYGNTGACNNLADTTDVCHVYHYCSPDSGQSFILSVNLEAGPIKLSSTTTACEHMSGSHIYYVYSN